jgi:hypothetical protein
VSAQGRGRADRPSGAGDRPWGAGDGAPGAGDRPWGAGDGAPGAGPAAPAAPSCTVALCPICAVVTSLGEAAPELAAHLALAGRELLVALRSLIDARLQTLDAPEPATRLERVTLEPG